MPESKDWGELAVVSTLGLPSNTITLKTIKMSSETAQKRINGVKKFKSVVGVTPLCGILVVPQNRLQSHVPPVCQVGGHDEVVLHDKAGLLGMQDEPLDHLGRH